MTGTAPPIAQPINAALRHVPVWAVYALGLLPPPVLVWMGATGALGVEPIKALEHALGEWALNLLIAGLAITPLRRLTGVNLMRFRRAIGLIAFYHLLSHLLVWLLLDVQLPAQIWADIVKRPYVTVGMAGFVLLVPLAASSSDAALRRLGPLRWRRLHRLVYPAALLGALHQVMVAKGFQIEPLVMLGAVLGLLALRLPLAPRRRRAARAESRG